MEDEFKESEKKLNFNTKLDHMELYENEQKYSKKFDNKSSASDFSRSSERNLFVKDILKRQQMIARHSKNEHIVDRELLEKAVDFKKVMNFSFMISAQNNGTFVLTVDEDDLDYAEEYSNNMEPLKIIIVKIKNFNKTKKTEGSCRQ